MNISFENPDKMHGLLTIVVEEADFKEKVAKQLKDIRKKANVPGFRPGQAPMGMIKRQYEPQVKADEINKLMGESLYKHIEDNKINMLGNPLPNLSQEPVDLEKPAPYTFKFDIAVAPDFNITLGKEDTVDFYDIAVEDATVEHDVDAYASQFGEQKKVDDYQDNDIIKGDLRQLDAEGNTLEGGITVADAMLMPSYIHVDEQKKLFDGVKVGDIVTFCPKKAYPENDSEVASLLKMKREEVSDLNSDFTIQVTEIMRHVKAELNEELFKKVFPTEEIKDAEAFKAKIKANIEQVYAQDADYKFLLDARAYAMGKVGEMSYPEDLLKRIMLANNKDKGEKFVEDNFKRSVEELSWSLVRGELVRQREIKLEKDDLMASAIEATRAQFAQYGMSNVPDEYLTSYAEKMIKDEKYMEPLAERSIDKKLIAKLKEEVTLNHKAIGFEDFNKMMEEKK